MEKTSWLDENVCGKVRKVRKAIIRMLISFLVLWGAFMIWQICSAGDFRIGKETPIYVSVAPIFLTICALLNIKATNESVYKDRVIYAMKELGTVQDLEEDMRNAKKFENAEMVTFVGSRYIINLSFTMFSQERVTVIKYDDAVSVKIVDARFKAGRGSQTGIQIQINRLGKKAIDFIGISNKKDAIGIIGEMEEQLSRGEQRPDTENQLSIKEQVASKLNKRDWKLNIGVVVVGAMLMIGSTLYYGVKGASIPMDYQYEETIKAVAYKVGYQGGINYIYYADTTSSAMFREVASEEEYNAARIGGATVYREKYTSNKAQKSVFLKEKNLSAKEVKEKARGDEFLVLLFGWIFGFIVLFAGALLMAINIRRAKSEKVIKIQ
ncbi:hypothetical protein [Anaerosporobacter sp.]|uniref:hypothetical protein n=1 Tax=Anaerosporobacter sp. TaxID=1872529 RepID=UPI00286EE453|nr:hypothetical protein [Anaerosporobacter sp.]